MDEITRCLEVLGLKPGASLAEMKKSYRELLMVWHPDRFPSDSPLHTKAEGKVKELNIAYEFLLEHGFRHGEPVLPEKHPSQAGPQVTEVEPSQTPQESPRRIYLWGLLAIIAIIGIWLWLKKISDQAGASSGQPVLDKRSTIVQSPDLVAASQTTTDAESRANTISGKSSSPGSFSLSNPGDLLNRMRPVGGCEAMTTTEGMLISGEGNFLTRDEYRPPFVIRTSAKTDLTNIRLVFGKGVVILNWEMNPTELRFHDPLTGIITGVPGQGRVPAEEWQDVEWEVQTNYTVVRVNGQVRARFEGNYDGLADLVGFHTMNGVHIGVRRFEVQTLPANPAQPIDLRTGLVLYFPFDTDEKDRATDHSGFGNHGKVQGATFDPLGRVGGALLFQGGAKAGSRVVVPHSASLVAMQRQWLLQNDYKVPPDTARHPSVMS